MTKPKPQQIYTITHLARVAICHAKTLQVMINHDEVIAPDMFCTTSEKRGAQAYWSEAAFAKAKKQLANRSLTPTAVAKLAGISLNEFNSWRQDGLLPVPDRQRGARQYYSTKLADKICTIIKGGR